MAGRRLVAWLAGLVTGAALTVVVAFGEDQVRLAAGGAVQGIGRSGVLVVSPQWATALAAAVALLVVGGVALALELARGDRRGFWVAVAIPPLLAIALGVSFAPQIFDPQLPDAVVLLVNLSHSTLLLALVCTAVVFAWRASPRATRASAEPS